MWVLKQFVISLYEHDFEVADETILVVVVGLTFDCLVLTEMGVQFPQNVLVAFSQSALDLLLGDDSIDLEVVLFDIFFQIWLRLHRQILINLVLEGVVVQADGPLGVAFEHLHNLDLFLI